MTNRDYYLSPAWREDRMRVHLAIWRLNHGGRVFNFSTRRVGGLRFVKLGRITFMFCVSKEYRPL